MDSKEQFSGMKEVLPKKQLTNLEKVSLDVNEGIGELSRECSVVGTHGQKVEKGLIPQEFVRRKLC